MTTPLLASRQAGLTRSGESLRGHSTGRAPSVGNRTGRCTRVPGQRLAPELGTCALEEKTGDRVGRLVDAIIA